LLCTANKHDLVCGRPRRLQRSRSSTQLHDGSEGALYNGLDPDLMRPPGCTSRRFDDLAAMPGLQKYRDLLFTPKRQSDDCSASQQSDLTNQFWRKFRFLRSRSSTEASERTTSSTGHFSECDNLSAPQRPLRRQDSDSTISELSMEDTTTIKVFDRNGRLTKTAEQIQRAEALGLDPCETFKPPRSVKFVKKEMQRPSRLLEL
jgi:hypothetical protein